MIGTAALAPDEQSKFDGYDWNITVADLAAGKREVAEGNILKGFEEEKGSAQDVGAESAASGEVPAADESKA